MLVVGLTGGIGSGKTAVSRIFETLGAPVIDTDVLARALVAPGQPALAQIVAAFGTDCLDTSGALNRAQLRRIVFANAAKRARLEAILHPKIRACVQQRIAQLQAPYCIVVIPLLLESDMSDLVDRILVVDVPEAIQIQRVIERDRMDRAQAAAMLAAQASRAERLAIADDIIDNSGSIAALEPNTVLLHQRYLKLATRSERSTHYSS